MRRPLFDSEAPRLFRFPWRSRRQIHREVDEELLFHLDCQVEGLRAAGLSEAEAHREAHRRFGDLGAAQAQLKAAGRRRERSLRRQLMVHEFLRDVRYAWRSLKKSPGFTATAVLVLALGIGINSAIFSIVNMMMLRPIQIEDAHRLVGIYSQDSERPENFRNFSYPSYLDIRDDNRVFTDLAGFTITLAGITEGDLTRRVMAGVVTSNYFETLGVAITHGRSFAPTEEKPGGDATVALVSHDYWRRHGGDGGSAGLGKTLRVNGTALTVVGVAPEGFTGTTALAAPDLWLPLGIFEQVAAMPGSRDRIDLTDRRDGQLMLFGRLRPGLDLENAESQMAPLATSLESAYPQAHENQAFVLARLPRLAISNAPTNEAFLVGPLVLIMAMGGIVLLIACLNLANMFLARGANRRVELAIRLSLGGGRLRLLRQLLSEGLVLSLLGGIGGLALAFGGTRWLFASVTDLIPLGMTLRLDTSPDLRVFAATLIFCALATVLAGLGPAWKLASGDVLEGLKETAGQSLSGGGKRAVAPRNLLVTLQIALSLALLSAGGLFMRGAVAASDETPGFSLDGGVLAELDTGLVGYDDARGKETYRRVASELRALPGVQTASLASIVPFGAVTQMGLVQRTGETEEENAVSSHRYVIGNGYFETLGLPILRGRDFSVVEAFEDDASRVAIIDEPLAKRLWPDLKQPADDAVGRSIELPARDAGEEATILEVIGVVPGIKHQFWDDEPPPHLYLPMAGHFASNMHFHLRLDEGLAEAQGPVMQQVRERIRGIDANLPVLELKTMQDHRDQSLFLWLVGAAAKFFSVLGALALLLSLVGVYGTGAFVAARRTREIGVRMALGATRGTVLRQMLRESLRMTLIGLALGVVLALGTAKLLSALIYQASSEAPVVLLIAALLLAAASTLASFLPARRATGIEPIRALRQD